MSLPQPQDAAARLLCLMSQGARAYFEGVAQADDADAAEEARERIHDLLGWLQGEQLMPRFSARERALMDKPAGAWSDRDCLNAGWRTESAGVIAWALTLVAAIPPYDKQFRALHIMEAIPMTGDPTAEFLQGAKLRSEGEIDEARAMAELWLWRSRTRRAQTDLSRSPTETTPEQYAQYIRESAANREAEGWFTAINGDYPAFGKAYADLSPKEYAWASSIALERLWGLNWLCDDERDWDQVSLDT